MTDGEKTYPGSIYTKGAGKRARLGLRRGRLGRSYTYRLKGASAARHGAARAEPAIRCDGWLALGRGLFSKPPKEPPTVSPCDSRLGTNQSKTADSRRPIAVTRGGRVPHFVPPSSLLDQVGQRGITKQQSHTSYKSTVDMTTSPDTRVHVCLMP